jgi:hypothetical protein
MVILRQREDICAAKLFNLPPDGDDLLAKVEVCSGSLSTIDANKSNSCLPGKLKELTKGSLFWPARRLPAESHH